MATRFVCPCSNPHTTIEDGKDREFVSECPVCVANKGNYKESPFWKEVERDPLPPPPWRVEEVDLSTGSADGTVLPFPSTARARTAANIRGRDKKAKKAAAAKAAAAAAGK